ncbi:fibronectin type III domain-containing protein [Dyadobacter endophyticus]|uniref:fibronectin type III domain-containing protein n=1 Tax=Dyadobacter endophyticus TaxID=1749036 RepID=UPI003CEF6CE5
METKPAHQGAPGHAAAGALLVWLLLFGAAEVLAQTIVPYQSNWKYLQDGVVQNGSTWATAGYNDASWQSGNAPFGFGSNAGYTYATTLQRGPNNTTPNHPVFYFRKSFQVSNTSAYASLRLRATLDDGIVIYIGGVEVARKNMTPSQGGYAGTPVGTPLLTIDTVLSVNRIQNGTNIIAVELHQTGQTSSDIYFDLQLDGEPAGAPPSLFRHPYLQLASHNQMTVYWYTNVKTNASVRYSTNPDLEIYQEVRSSVSDTLHTVTLKNLAPDTQYYYSVGYYSGYDYVQLQYNPSVNYFRTLHDPADTTKSLRFWLLGDSGAGQSTNPRPYNVRDAYLAYLASKNNPKVDGMLFLGDNSNTFPYEGLQTALDLTLFKFYNNPSDKQLLSRIPSWTVIGNHDYDPDLAYKTKSGKTIKLKKGYQNQTAASFSAFAYPDSAQIGGEPTYNKKGYYSFNQSNVHFVVLNPPMVESQNVNENWERESSTAGYYDLFSKNSIAMDDSTNSPIDSLPQVKWLVKDLTKNKQKWTVVTFHLPPFSTIGHFPTEKDLLRVQEKLLPILEKPEYHVDALVVSHSHAYERAGMIRKKGTQARTSDYTQTGGQAGNGNLGRYPNTLPYAKTNSETAYTYILSGSAGRGWYTTSLSDGGYTPGSSSIKHPSTSVPPLDNLTGDNTTDFYHKEGGSVELVFQENRLDVKFIKESDVSPKFVVADSFVVMKDVSKKKTMTIQNGGDAVKLTASWIGKYNWYTAQQPGVLLASGVRDLSIGPGSSSTFYVKDDKGYLADTFIVNVTNPKPVSTGDTLIKFRSQWLLPLMAGIMSKDIKLEKQCIAPWSFTGPPFEMPVKSIAGFGHGDEGYPMATYLIEKVMVPAERLWFRRSFVLNGSAQTYAGFKLTLLRDKNLSNRKSFYTKEHLLLVNGQPIEITASSTKDLGNGREEVTYTLSNRGFVYGINYILVSYYIYPMSLTSVNPATDPFTFDAQLISMPLGLAPPPASKQFKLGTVALSQQTCAGDTVSVEFEAVGNESGFPVLYEARLVTATGDIPFGEGTRSPILGRLPRGLAEGKYKVRIATKNAFMDDLEGPETFVKALPTAAILPAPAVTVWKGEFVTLSVKFAGPGPWHYVASDGTEGTSAVADTSIRVKAGSTGPYMLRSVSNGCGAGDVSGAVEVAVKEPFLTVSDVSQLTSAPFKTALCDGDSVAVSFTVTGPDRARTYAAQLSDANGGFGSAALLGNSAGSPVRMRLPAALAEGNDYRIRVVAVNPDVDFTSSQSDAQPIRSRAEGNFTLSKAAVFEGEDVELKLFLKGTLPAYYYLRYGADILSGTTSEPTAGKVLTVRQTTVFSLDSVRNVCGYGLVAGNRTVTVSLLVGVDPFSGNGITAYPNPATERLMLRGKSYWRDAFQWHIYGADGKLFQKGIGVPSPGASYEIDTRMLPSGLYILKLNRGKQENSWKIIKK